MNRFLRRSTRFGPETARRPVRPTKRHPRFGHVSALGAARKARAGVTLIEVLMSMMVMAIGVTIVATLFPVSVLRSIEATRLTTGAALRYSVEGFVDASGNAGCPQAAIALDPDFNQNPQYNISGADFATFSGENYVVDPLGYWRLREAGLNHTDTPGTPQARVFGTWPPGDAGRARFLYRFHLAPYLVASNNPAANPGLRGDVDPIVWSNGLAAGDPGKLDLAGWLRVTANGTALPDNFAHLGEAIGDYTDTTVTFPAGALDFSGFEIDPTSLGSAQVTIFASDGRQSIRRNVTFTGTGDYGQPGIFNASGALNGGSTLAFGGGLPPGFPQSGSGRIMVEVQENRYTWMLTVRNQPYNGGRIGKIDVVIFFRRSFGADAEQIYVLSREAPADQAAAFRQEDQRRYSVTWDPATQPRPDLTDGRWLFDPANFRWHKVGKVVGETATQMVFTLEGTEAAGETLNRVMFVPGVVDVYPLSKTSLQSAN